MLNSTCRLVTSDASTGVDKEESPSEPAQNRKTPDQVKDSFPTKAGNDGEDAKAFNWESTTVDDRPIDFDEPDNEIDGADEPNNEFEFQEPNHEYSESLDD